MSTNFFNNLKNITGDIVSFSVVYFDSDQATVVAVIKTGKQTRATLSISGSIDSIDQNIFRKISQKINAKK